MKNTNNKITLTHSPSLLLLGLTSVAISLLPTIAEAQPSISGNTISWPDNGWYQVQNASDLSTTCEGGTQCVVAAGVYNVINLTLHKRFENIVVGDTPPEESSAGVTVAGNTLSWPNNGWYQVQDALDYSTVCEGGFSCTVTPGSYIVINHTLGQRVELDVGDATVDPGTPPNNNSNWSIDGNMLNLHGSGWYQVQRSDTYETVCEGFRPECMLDNGSYTVIHHYSGQRWDNVVINHTVNSGPLISLERYADVLVPVLELARGEPFFALIDKTNELLPARRDSSPDGYSLTGQTSDNFASVSSESASYNCNEGGELRYSRGSTGNGRVSSYNYRADNCQVNSFLMNGVHGGGSGDGVADSWHFNGPFTLTNLNNGSTQTITGSLSRRPTDAPGDANLAIGKFTSNAEGELTVSNFSSRVGSTNQTFSVEFEVTSDWTNGELLTVSTSTEFGQYEGTRPYQSGILSIKAADGSSMFMDARNGDPETFLLVVSSNQSVIGITVAWDEVLSLPCLGSVPYPESLTNPTFTNQGCRDYRQWPNGGN